MLSLPSFKTCMRTDLICLFFSLLLLFFPFHLFKHAYFHLFLLFSCLCKDTCMTVFLFPLIYLSKQIKPRFTKFGHRKILIFTYNLNLSKIIFQVFGDPWESFTNNYCPCPYSYSHPFTYSSGLFPYNYSFM